MTLSVKPLILYLTITTPLPPFPPPFLSPRFPVGSPTLPLPAPPAPIVTVYVEPAVTGKADSALPPPPEDSPVTLDRYPPAPPPPLPAPPPSPPPPPPPVFSIQLVPPTLAPP